MFVVLLSGDPAGAARHSLGVFPLTALATPVDITTGRWLDVRLGRKPRTAEWTVLLVALLLLEVRPQLNADLLLDAWPN
ncbi:hypothetical protein ACSHWB_45000 [Lentzea sp. HUAS TT2]|uniref:hypothetical protein n=1 Tax=Lentzea sp. HUAS TT2 TaxID=3447454 RepID=UPI003F719B21